MACGLHGGARGVRRAAAAILLLVALGGARADDAGTAPPPVTVGTVLRAYAEFRDKLESLAGWCDERRLFVERSRAAEALLLFDPDHERARDWLGFRRAKDGSWTRTEPPPAVDANKEALPEWTRRRDDLAAPFRSRTATPVPRPMFRKAAALRDRVNRALVGLLPDDPVLRENNGETRVAGTWMLKESAATAAGRRRMADAVREARKAAAKLKPEYGREPDWVAVFGLGDLTVRSALPKSVSEEFARAVAGGRELLSRVLETPLKPSGTIRVYAFADYWSHKRFLGARSDLSEEERKHDENMSGYWIGSQDLVLWYVDQPNRVDAAARLAISAADTGLGRMYLASDWMGEGMGMYLTYALVGTRLTVFVQDTEYSDEAIGRESADPRSDWVALARRMVDTGHDPKIPIVVGTPLNSMTKDDGLMAYALAAYFLESRPEDAAKLVGLTQFGTTFHDALAMVCGLDAEGLQARFIRWLHETK